MLLLSSLPATSFLKFNANKASRPELSWENSRGLPGVSLEAHAYFIPLKADPNAATLAANKSFLGERYGGVGLAGNGGGVRCGLDGQVQIKGIGRNPLAGKTTDFFHSYGGASLNEGIVEAIWGEILHSALPYGAVRIYGLITTGTRVPLLFPKDGCDPTTARALIVREAALRPAHYMRSIYYDPAPNMESAPDDTTRTRSAISKLLPALDSIFGQLMTDGSETSEAERLNQYIAKMLNRFAAQIACARAKRIMHGSLIASNLSLDGRWLDFSTTSTMPDYGRIIISPGAPDFMHEEETLKKTVYDLSFYLRKYLTKIVASALVDPKECWQNFKSHVNARLEIEFLKLTGVPIESINKIAPEVRQKLFESIFSIITSGNNRVYSILTGSAMPERSGSFHLNRILMGAATSKTQVELDGILNASLGDDQIRSEFVNRYTAFRESYFAQCDELNRSRFGQYMLLNCIRMNTTMPKLYRSNLYQSIENLLVGKGDVPAFINDHIDDALTLLAEPKEGVIDLSRCFKQRVTVDPIEGITIDGVRADLHALLALGQPRLLSGDLAEKLVRYA